MVKLLKTKRKYISYIYAIDAGKTGQNRPKPYIFRISDVQARPIPVASDRAQGDQIGVGFKASPFITKGRSPLYSSVAGGAQ
jgi:hypothetical protein